MVSIAECEEKSRILSDLEYLEEQIKESTPEVLNENSSSIYNLSIRNIGKIKGTPEEHLKSRYLTVVNSIMSYLPPLPAEDDNTPKYYCPLCQQTGVFRDFGYPLRQKVKCHHCGSLERHRLLWLYFERFTNLFSDIPQKILHVAAEPCLQKRIEVLPYKEYITADLQSPKAMIKMDITDIQYPDGEFDIIICNHVLEHIVDDIKAMKELHRVLQGNGWAILLVPISDNYATYEDSTITDEKGRLKAFGQEDHVRRYGLDYVDRLSSVGFKVTSFTLTDLGDITDIDRMGVLRERCPIFYCKK